MKNTRWVLFCKAGLVVVGIGCAAWTLWFAGHSGGKAESTGRNKKPIQEGETQSEVESEVVNGDFSSLAGDLKVEGVSAAGVQVMMGRLVGKGELDRALLMIEEQADDGRRMHAIMCLIVAWSKVDPDACFAWCQTLDRAEDRAEALARCARAVAEVHGGGRVLAMLDAIPDDRVKWGAYKSAAWALVDSDRDEVIRRLSEIGDSGAMGSLVMQIANDMVKKGDYEQMEQFFNEAPYGLVRDSFQRYAVAALSVKDPNLAFDWVDGSAGGDQIRLFGDVGSGFGSSCPVEGLARTADIGDDRARSQFVGGLILAWCSHDVGAVSDYVAKGIRSGEGADHIEEMVGVLVKFDAGAVHEMLSEGVGSVSRLSNVRNEAVVGLAYSDPRRASEWINEWKLIDSEQGVGVVSRVVDEWMMRDSMAASEWIESLPVGGAKDHGIVSMVQFLIEKEDFENARSWWAEIGDEDLRKRTEGGLTKRPENVEVTK